MIKIYKDGKEVWSGRAGVVPDGVVGDKLSVNTLVIRPSEVDLLIKTLSHARHALVEKVEVCEVKAEGYDSFTGAELLGMNREMYRPIVFRHHYNDVIRIGDIKIEARNLYSEQGLHPANIEILEISRSLAKAE